MGNETEASNYPGFYEIPGYGNYVISREGLVVNKTTGEFLKGSPNPAGYVNYRITGDDGITLTWGRHRLMAYVFLTEEQTLVEKLVVNHRNGVKGDDRLDNFEWTTHQGNIEHAGAMGLTDKCSPISVRNVVTGEVTKYPSIIECARVTGLTKDAINYRIKQGEDRVYPELKQYRLGHQDSPWVIPEDLGEALHAYGRNIHVQARNVLTGEIREFAMAGELAAYLGVSPAYISQWLDNPHQPVLEGYVQIKRLHDPTPWREVGDPHLELAQTLNSRPVIAIRENDGSKTVYASIARCADAFGLKTTALHHRLKKEGQKAYDGYRFMYYTG